jgi:3-oxoacyl-[acyl-carrier-protein] synthase-1
MSALVTGGGIICALGSSETEVLASFLEHQSGMSVAAFLQTRHRDSYVFGEVSLSNQQLAEKHNIDPALSRTILLSYHAAKTAYDTIPVELLASSRVGFISATSVGGMDKTEQFFEDYLVDSASGNLSQVLHHECGRATDFVARRLGIKDFVTTISTACSSSANALMLGARMLKAGLLDVVIAGGVDPLTRFTFNGFNTLMIVDPMQCKPLDAAREGLNLGEGAAYLVLMSEQAAQALPVPARCRLTGYANTNDAFHQTALSDQGEGPYLAMQQALLKSGLQPTDIDYINMHGTGTRNNDLAEGNAIQRLFGGVYPKLSSTKSFTGHTLAASGAIEAYLSVLTVTDGYIFPNFSFDQSVETLDLIPETAFYQHPGMRHVLSNSFGFGGNCSSLIFSRT